MSTTKTSYQDGCRGVEGSSKYEVLFGHDSHATQSGTSGNIVWPFVVLLPVGHQRHMQLMSIALEVLQCGGGCGCSNANGLTEAKSYHRSLVCYDKVSTGISAEWSGVFSMGWPRLFNSVSSESRSMLQI